MSTRRYLRARILTSCLPTALALGLLAAPSGAQWSVDPATATLRLEGEVYADQGCNGLVIRPGPADLQGTCPPAVHAVIPGANAQILHAGGNLGLNFPSAFFDFGNGIDFKVDDGVGPGCNPPFATWARSDTAGFLQGYGLGSRTLRIAWSAELHQLGSDPDFFMRGCTQLESALQAAFVVPQTNHPVLLRWDLASGGGADTHWECPDPGGFCFNNGLPIPEDTEHASMEVRLGINGVAPGLVLDVDLNSDPLSGLPDLWPPQLLSQAVSFAPGTAQIDVDLDLFAETGAMTQFPYPGPEDEGEVQFGGSLTLHVIVHDVELDMVPIPKGGAGPVYAYSVSRYEITNQEYADFLNSAQLDGGATGLGSFLQFGFGGEVTMPSGDILFLPQGPGTLDSHVVYSPAAPLGTRYTVEVAQKADARSYERHPVNHVTWFGALKFCNWLTLNRGLPASERCYTEGPNPGDWHPVTISTADWATRDLTRAERSRLVVVYGGFRLPMDELDTATGWVGKQVRHFNEWYKAAAYDPGAPLTVRAGPNGELVPPAHWVWSTGRDTISSSGMNSFQSGDPFDDDDAFVGLFDGTTYNNGVSPTVGNGSLFTAQANANPYGIHDLSGNVAEWNQDKVPGVGMAVRGGSYDQLPPDSAPTYREGRPASDEWPWLGFRVVQTVPMKALPASQPAPPAVTFP